MHKFLHAFGSSNFQMCVRNLKAEIQRKALGANGACVDEKLEADHTFGITLGKLLTT